MRERIERVAATDFTVLIEGESGTGKELVARQIHELSRRRKGPFVAVNCAAIVETLLEAELFGIEDRTATGVRGRRGKFEHAHEGTLFLDEVSDLSPAAQAKLLRAIQDLSVERVGGIGPAASTPASSSPPTGRWRRWWSRGRFRLDLFYRLERRRHAGAAAARTGATTCSSWRGTSSSVTGRSAAAVVGGGGRRAAGLRLAGQRARARAGDRARRRAGRVGRSSSSTICRRRCSAATPTPCCRRSMRDDDDAGVGQPLCAAGAGAVQNNKRQACRELGISYHTLQGYLRFRPGEGPTSHAAR